MAGMTVRKATWVGRARMLAFFVLALLVSVLIGLVLEAKPAHAKTFAVNSTGDNGDQSPGDGSCFTGTFIFNVGAECTLRAAIEEANAFAGADTINFAIPGAAPHTISPGFQLPTITQRVTIDGYTESLDESTPASPNTASTGTNAVLKIELGGTNAGFSSGLLLSGAGASNSVIRGLVINKFFSFGIYLLGGTGYKIEGNFIGTDPSGTAAEANGNAVTILASDSTIGGTTPDKRNLISGNKSHAIQVAGGSGNKIQGNLIGTKANGTEALGNGVPSGGAGVIVGSSSNIIGDSDPSDGLTNAANVIAFNIYDGVAISGNTATGYRILSNSIFSNGKLGIELFGGTEDANGVTANDPDDPNTSKPDPDKDTGPNRLQNYPVLDLIQKLAGDTTITVTGDLNSTPSTRKKKRTFIIQFFSSPASSSEEGKTFLGQRVVKTDRKGNASFDFVSPQDVSLGDYVTATATNKATGDTSEFSAAQRVEGLVIGP